MPGGVWRRDRITGGWRYWVTEYRGYSEPGAFRINITAAIRSMTWYPPSGVGMPMSPRLGLQEICRQRELKMVAGLGVSSTPLEYPEDPHIPAYLDQSHDPIWATYSLIAIKQLIHRGWLTSYFLDRGVEIGGVALDFVREARPERLSVMCALNRHEECTGLAWTRRWLLVPQRTPCVCVCGCRSPRRGGGERPGDAAEEVEDLKPNDEVGAITHEEPPNEE
ncbi:hypothetical protein GCM10023319_35010 [Nocardia iowensis]